MTQPSELDEIQRGLEDVRAGPTRDAREVLDKRRRSHRPVSGWALWRLDDNGNRFVVALFARRDEAEAAGRAFEAHGHKQTYWVEAAVDGAMGGLVRRG